MEMPAALVVSETDDVFHGRRRSHQEADLDSWWLGLTHAYSRFCEEEESAAA